MVAREASSNALIGPNAPSPVRDAPSQPAAAAASSPNMPLQRASRKNAADCGRDGVAVIKLVKEGSHVRTHRSCEVKNRDQSAGRPMRHRLRPARRSCQKWLWPLSTWSEHVDPLPGRGRGRGARHPSDPSRTRAQRCSRAIQALARSLALARVWLSALSRSRRLRSLWLDKQRWAWKRRTKRERFAEGGSRISTPTIDAPRLTVVNRWASKERRHDDRAQQRIAALASASQDCGSDSVESRVASLRRGTRLGGVQAPIKDLCLRPAFALGVEPFGEGHGRAAEAEAGLSARLRARRRHIVKRADRAEGGKRNQRGRIWWGQPWRALWRREERETTSAERAAGNPHLFESGPCRRVRVVHASRHGQVAARRAELRQSCGCPHLALRQTLDDDWAPWPRKLGFESFLRRPNARVRPRETKPVRCARAPAKARRRPSVGSRSCARPSSACRRARQQLLCARARVGDQARAGLGETSARNARARHRSSCALRRCEKSAGVRRRLHLRWASRRARGTCQRLARTRLRQRRDPRVARADDQGTTCQTPVKRRVSRARPRAFARAHTHHANESSGSRRTISSNAATASSSVSSRMPTKAR